MSNMKRLFEAEKVRMTRLSGDEIVHVDEELYFGQISEEQAVRRLAKLFDNETIARQHASEMMAAIQAGRDAKELPETHL